MHIVEAANKIGSTGDKALDYVRLSIALMGGEHENVNVVRVEPLPETLFSKISRRMAARACYHNALVTLKSLSRDDLARARYVLGFWDHAIPVEHCFVKIGDSYYDPTLDAYFAESRNEVRHFAVVELGVKELRQMCPPAHTERHLDIYDYLRIAARQKMEAL